MKKSSLNGVTSVLPFDSQYIKVGKDKDTKWNLMNANGSLISDTWFSSITKNTDGSIVTESVRRGRAKPVEAKFLNVSSLVQTVKVMDVVPIACVSMLDTGTIIPISNSSRYVAKAKLYGRDVYVDKNGNIYDTDGNKLRLLFNTIDCERLYRAMDTFNRKLHYDYKAQGGTFEDCRDNNISIFCFFFATDDLCVITDMPKLEMRTGTKKWTDDFIVRVLPDIIPEKVCNMLKKAFGAAEETNKSVRYWTWHLHKEDIEKVLDTLAAA